MIRKTSSIFSNRLSFFYSKELLSLPQISLIYADKQQSYNNQAVFLCDIMQQAAFACVICVICGRITRKSTQSIRTDETPVCHADLADLRRQTPNNKTALTIPTCLSLRNNAACCIRLRDLRNLRENNTQEDSIYIAQMNPNVSRRSRRLSQTNHKTQNNITPNPD